MKKSKDKGLTWTRVSNDTTLYKPFFIDDSLGYCISREMQYGWESYNYLYKSNDGFSSLDTLINNFSGVSVVSDIFFPNEKEGIVIGGVYGSWKTSDGGNSWEYIPEPIYELEVVSESLIYFTGLSNTSFFYTPNMFEDIYRLYENPNKTDYPILSFVNNGDIGYLFGYEDFILKYIRTTEIENTIDTYGFVLNQNYPNPFNPSTEIKYNLSEDVFVQLKVYNILGAEVETLVNDYQSLGEHKIIFNAINLPSGIYFYLLKVGEYNETKKMVLLR